MEKNKEDYKIILTCNKQGILEQIFLDTGSLFESIKLPIGFHSLISPISIRVFGSFWLSILHNAMVENTLLTLFLRDKQITFFFTGYLLDERVLLCGNTELTSTEKVLEEIMVINNEQANQIRITEKKVDIYLQDVEKNEINQNFLNDFSALNNELINSKRELMSKNKKIELLNAALNDVNEHMTMFTYSISHDLKEPVRMVKSFLTLLQKKYGETLDPKAQEYVHIALDGANRLSNMISDLLIFHQTSGSDDIEIVDLNIVTQEVLLILQKEIEAKNAQVTSAKLPEIKGSAAGFRQVFQNLISNAIKFVPEGVTPNVSIDFDEDDTKYTLRIKDNGIGIPESQKQDVFKLFKRLNSSQEYEGTGMGLAMVKKSIERMGGEIWLESEEGIGSTFFLRFNKVDLTAG